MRSKLAAFVALSMITAGTAASAQASPRPSAESLSLRSAEPIEGANAAEGAWILIPIVGVTLAALIIAVTVSDNGVSDSP